MSLSFFMRSELTSGMQKTSAGKSEVPRNCAATQVIPFACRPTATGKTRKTPSSGSLTRKPPKLSAKSTAFGIEGNGIETTARILQESGILTPTYYWAKKGIRKGGKKTQDNPYKWCKTTITKILTLQEYTGVLINFKTYSKSFKDKRRRENPEENQKVFENHHEPIIDRSTWETVQKIRAGTKCRQPKNSEKICLQGFYTAPTAAISCITISIIRTAPLSISTVQTTGETVAPVMKRTTFVPIRWKRLSFWN